MKPNAHLYLPMSVIDEYLASIGKGPPRVQQEPPRPKATAEQLEGGCTLYRLDRPAHQQPKGRQ
jgi:hypothetical protein